MSTGKQTPAPMASEKRNDPAEEAIKKTGKADDRKEKDYPKPSQKD